MAELPDEAKEFCRSGRLFHVDGFDTDRPCGTCSGCQAFAAGREYAAGVAERQRYPFPDDMLAKSGRGRFYQQNITAAWAQAAHWIAREIRGGKGESDAD